LGWAEPADLPDVVHDADPGEPGVLGRDGDPAQILRQGHRAARPGEVRDVQPDLHARPSRGGVVFDATAGGREHSRTELIAEPTVPGTPEPTCGPQPRGGLQVHVRRGTHPSASTKTRRATRSPRCKSSST